MYCNPPNRTLLLSGGGSETVIELWISLSTAPSTAFPTLSSKGSQQVHVVLADPPFRLSQLFDPPAGMQHRRVISAAESIPDLRQAVIGQLLHQRHRDLARPGDATAATLLQPRRTSNV